MSESVGRRRGLIEMITLDLKSKQRDVEGLEEVPPGTPANDQRVQFPRSFPRDRGKARQEVA